MREYMAAMKRKRLCMAHKQRRRDRKMDYTIIRQLMRQNIINREFFLMASELARLTAKQETTREQRCENTNRIFYLVKKVEVIAQDNGFERVFTPRCIDNIDVLVNANIFTNFMLNTFHGPWRH